jgi:hypothetical protein
MKADVGRTATLGGAQRELTRVELLNLAGMNVDPLSAQNYEMRQLFFWLISVSF